MFVFNLHRRAQLHGLDDDRLGFQDVRGACPADEFGNIRSSYRILRHSSDAHEDRYEEVRAKMVAVELHTRQALPMRCVHISARLFVAC